MARTTLLGAACRHGVAIRASATRARGGRPETINCRCPAAVPACPVSCSSLPLHSQLQYVVVEVRASEQPAAQRRISSIPVALDGMHGVANNIIWSPVTARVVRTRACVYVLHGTVLAVLVQCRARVRTVIYVCSAHACMAARSMHGLLHVCMYMYVRTRHRSRALAPARYDGGGQARCPTPCRRSDPCPCLIPGLDRVTRRPGGRRHARGASACYGTGVYICMAVRCAARGEGVRVRGRHHALRYYSARPLLAAAHSTLRSIWPCVHACRGEHYSRHTRLPHMASWTTVSRLAHVLCTLNFVFRLFLAESFFFSLRAGKCTVGDIRHGTRYTRTIQCTFSRSCSIALFVLLRLLGPILTIGCSFFNLDCQSTYI